jgi:hypothetical protein
MDCIQLPLDTVQLRAALGPLKALNILTSLATIRAPRTTMYNKFRHFLE